MFGLGLPEVLIILVIILLIFGAKRLPSIGAGLGKTVKEIKGIKKELSGGQEKPHKTEAKQDQLPQGNGGASGDEGSTSLQKKLTDQVVSRVPGLKQARNIKDKAEKIKKIVS
jgi:sec-independent protein translocase protein TatA